MRIANNFFLPKAVSAGVETALFVALGVCFFASAEAYAAAPVAPSVGAPVFAPQAPMPSAVSAPAIATTAVAAPAFQPPPGSVTPAAGPGQGSANPGALPATIQLPEAAKPQGAEIAKALSSMEDKTTESAKNLVKRLDSAETTTLSDLNTARQTVTRIEALIDVEKRLGELEKLRGDRNARSLAAISMPTSLANAIPASALQPLSRPNAGHPPQSEAGFPQNQPFMRMGGSGRAEITRIVGAEGKYVAVLKLPDGEKKSVKVGDKVTGQGTVRAITSSSVEVAEKGSSYTLRVKNVDAIYSAMR